ncbi:acyltransferase family protein [uncultured Sulfitobacter sp.]|uniref:acyltransferase family protein n=1 Tax=uncultured Sulfitobacter sp. TaxID=191468 RepID=UPI002636A0FD|nr:acyltransferase family protein [uncultured Sulfitobacter sp.]
MQYRAEIDGLRALAVVPVMLFHADVALFGGGFVGVDVFFVISGYLITTLIAQDLSRGRFSIVDFYQRRARRILPALCVVVLATVPFAWAILLPRDLLDFAQSVLATATFSSNILFWRESGYFGTQADLKPLLHTWSLAVEEQYYILFPLFMVAVWWRGLRAVALALTVLFAVSFAGSVWGSSVKPSAAFYLLPSRGWELLAGAFAALWLGSREMRTYPISGALALAGIGMIVLAVFAFDATTPFPGIAALLPVMGSVMIVLFAGPATWVGRVLAWRPLVGIGLISYSAYLWHQPILALVKYRTIDHLGPVAVTACLMLTLALAWASWAWVERPFRDRGRLPGTRVLWAGGALLAAMAVVGAVGTWQPFGIGGSVRPALYTSDVRVGLRNMDQFAQGIEGPSIVIWGDSFADALTLTLGTHLNDADLPMHGLIKRSCPSLLGTQRNDAQRLGRDFAADCERHNTAALARLDELQPSHVVLTSAYSWYMAARNDADEPILRAPDAPDTPAGQVVADSLVHTAMRISDLGIVPVVVLPHPMVERFNEIVRTGAYRRDPVTVDSEAARRDADFLADRLDTALGDTVTVVHAADLLCAPDTPACPVFSPEGKTPFLWYDGQHLSQFGAKRIAPSIVTAIRARPALPDSFEGRSGDTSRRSQNME